MGESTRVAYREIPYLETPQYILEMLEDPENFLEHMENYTSRIIARLSYGDAKHTMEVKHASRALIKAISPAAYLSNIIPQLSLLPAWISPWKKIEKQRHDEELDFFMRVYDETMGDMKDGKARESYLKSVLENKNYASLGHVEASYIVGMVGIAGVLTTSSALMNFVLAMCLYPEWQDKLQEEVDRVCGDRMPEFSDSPKLIVTRAIIIELLRWRPLTPGSKLD
jgi:cytochrome P450